jgi:hypothetical protein
MCEAAGSGFADFGGDWQVICAVPWTLPKRSDRRIKAPDGV